MTEDTRLLYGKPKSYWFKAQNEFCEEVGIEPLTTKQFDRLWEEFFRLRAN